MSSRSVLALNHRLCIRAATGVLVVGALATTGCGEEDGLPTSAAFDLFLNYTKPSTGVPTIEVDRRRTDDVISVPEEGQALENNSTDKRLVDISIANISISSRAGNFVIDSVEHAELRGGEYRGDSEFRSEFTELTRLAVVLVLDVSESLAEQFATLQAFAKQFVAEIKRNDPDAQIAVVAFADQVMQLPFTSDATVVAAYIDGLRQGRFTNLRDGVAAGLDLLLDSDLNVNGRSIVTFTDGNDNSSVTPLNDLAARLQEAQIKSFVVALEDRDQIFRNELEPLTANGALEVTTNVSGDDGLGEIFARFSGAVSNVYRVSYQRNDATFETPLSIRLRLNATLKTGRFEP